MPEPFDQPFGVVACDEVTDDLPRLGQRLEAMQIEALLRRRPHEALRDAITLRLAHVRRRDCDLSHFTSLIHASAMYCGPSRTAGAGRARRSCRTRQRRGGRLGGSVRGLTSASIA